MEKQKLDELRRRAKERLNSERDESPENAGEEVRKLLHELRTYQIELELQNDELRRVQEELVETRDQYIDLYDFAPFGYLTLSEKGVIVKANLTLADLLGEERRSLHGQPFTRFIFHKDQDRFATIGRRSLSSFRFRIKGWAYPGRFSPRYLILTLHPRICGIKKDWGWVSPLPIPS